jgi:hypothetical protein
MSNTNYGKLIGWLLGSWSLFAISASALHVFKNGPDKPPLALGLAALTPLILFAAWFAASTGFRDYVLSLSERTLTLAQAWRIGGFVFLVLYTYGILPGIFALPAGWGDIAIGRPRP